MKKKLRKKIRRIVAIAWVLLLCMHPFSVWAAQVDNGASYPVASNQWSGWPQGEDVTSETAILMDADTGIILYDKGMHQKRYPASITKIMTALLALENSSLEEQVTFTEACLGDQTYDSTHIGAQVGEVMTMEQCLMVMMLKSANDVATQIGVHVAGSTEAFAQMMNTRAQELGCTDTNFVNASGMPNDNQYTSAYDMALIFQEAIKIDKFREIIGTQSYTLPPTNLCGESRTYTTHHVMTTVGAQQYYEGCFGGKTGGSSASKNTLVSGALRDGMTLIAVTMRGENLPIWTDHATLFDYGYNNFAHLQVEGGTLTVPKETTVEQLETNEVDNSTMEYLYQGYAVGKGAVITPTPEPTQEQAAPENLSEEEPVEQEGISTAYYVIFGLVALILISLLILIVSLIKRK